MRAVRGEKVREDLGEIEFDEYEDEEDEIDRELRELDDRVKKWLQESRPPARTPSFNDDEFQLENEEKNTKRSEKRRYSIQETRTPPTCSTVGGEAPPAVGGESCTVLYHPDFADWKSCENELTAISPLERRNSPIIDGGTHTSISKLFNFLWNLKCNIP